MILGACCALLVTALAACAVWLRGWLQRVQQVLQPAQQQPSLADGGASAQRSAAETSSDATPGSNVSSSAEQPPAALLYSGSGRRRSMPEVAQTAASRLMRRRPSSGACDPPLTPVQTSGPAPWLQRTASGRVSSPFAAAAGAGASAASSASSSFLLPSEEIRASLERGRSAQAASSLAGYLSPFKQQQQQQQQQQPWLQGGKKQQQQQQPWLHGDKEQQQQQQEPARQGMRRAHSPTSQLGGLAAAEVFEGSAQLYALGGCPPSRSTSSGMDGAGSTRGTASLPAAEAQGSGSLESRLDAAEPAPPPGGAGPDQHEQLPSLQLDSLPPALRGWVVDESEVTYLLTPDGERQSLGRGASGEVFKAMLHGELVAAKEVPLQRTPELRRSFLSEAGWLNELRHPSVLAIYGIVLQGDVGVLLSEYCEGRDLFSALSVAHGGRRLFSWWHRGRRVFYDVCKALNYLHSKGICHADIKSKNVLLTDTFAAKLADVGLSRRQAAPLGPEDALVGTWAYIAPELLLGQARCFTPAMDSYSMGVLLWEICTGEVPVRGQLRMPRVPEECPSEVCSLMLRCLDSDPEARPNARELLQQLGDLRRSGSLDTARPLQFRQGPLLASMP